MNAQSRRGSWCPVLRLTCFVGILFGLTIAVSAKDEEVAKDTVSVVRLLDQARQPSNNAIIGFAMDSALSAQALERAQRIGWDRGVFKAHLGSLLSMTQGDYAFGHADWDVHFRGAMSRQQLASVEERTLLHLTASRRYAMIHSADTAALYIDTAQSAAARCGDERLKAVVMYAHAQALRRSERWGDAFRVALTTIAKAEELDDDLLRAFTYNLSGFIRGRLGDLDQAAKDLQTSLHLADSMDITMLRLRNHSNWGYMMQVKGRWREALDHYRMLHTIAMASDATKDDMSEIETGVGYMLLRLDSLDQAEEFLGRLHRANAMVGHPYEQEFNTAWAVLQLRRGRYQEAVKFARTAFATEQWDENDVVKRDASRVLADTYKALGQTGEALRWTEVTHQWEDSIRYRQQADQAMRLQLESEFAQRAIGDSLAHAETAALLEQQRAEARSMDREHRMQRINLFVLIGFVILFAGVLFVRSRTNRRMQLEQLRSRLSRDLHDDIGSTLSSINILSSVARRKAEAGDEAGAAASLTGISERTQRLMRNMSDIVWSVDPERDTLDELLARMREFGAAVLEPKGVVFRFNSAGESNATMPPAVKSDLYLIFKEAVNNAAKHAQATEVVVTFAQEKNNLRLTIADNGIGFDKSDGPVNSGGGNGLRNMRMRALEMKAEFRISSATPHGTTIDLSVAF